MHVQGSKTTATLLLGLALWVSSGVAPAANPDVATLSELRLEVDGLAAALRNQQNANASQLEALRSERMGLERQLRRERLKANTLAKVEDQRRLSARAKHEALEKLVPAVDAAITAARDYLEKSIPFRREERGRKIELARRELEGGDPASALRRVWRFVEHEVAMGREVAVSSDVIDWKGEAVRVTAVHIGGALLYHRFPDGRFAEVRYVDDDWHEVAFSEPRVVEALRSLFDTLESGQREAPVQLILAPEMSR
ncbi:MAG: DUF3450 family protein [Myxococcota bacterium]